MRRARCSMAAIRVVVVRLITVLTVHITMKFSLAVLLALAGPAEAFAPVKRAHGGYSSLQMVGSSRPCSDGWSHQPSVDRLFVL